MWRHYLVCKMFIFMSDHSGFRYLFHQLNLNARHVRWLAMISEFEFEIKYIKGKENRVVDSLRRRVHINHIASMSSYGTIYKIISFRPNKRMIGIESLGTSYNSRVQVIRMWTIFSQYMIWLDLGARSMCSIIVSSKILSWRNFMVIYYYAECTTTDKSIFHRPGGLMFPLN